MEEAILNFQSLFQAGGLSLCCLHGISRRGLLQGIQRLFRARAKFLLPELHSEAGRG